jgi:hypothetical protein
VGKGALAPCPPFRVKLIQRRWARLHPPALKHRNCRRFAHPTNLVMPRELIPAARFRPGDASLSALRMKRAQGVPDAGRTREPCVQRTCAHCARKKPQGSRTTGTPRAMVLTAASCSPRCTGLVSHRRLSVRHARLDPSVGRSGPHDLTVRAGAARLAPPARPPHPAPNTRDDRVAPLSRARDLL